MLLIALLLSTFGVRSCLHQWPITAHPCSSALYQTLSNSRTRRVISLLQDYDLVIDEGSVDLVKELNNYSWLEKKSQTPTDKFNHLIDAIRYAVSYQLSNPNRGKYSIL